MNMRICFLKAQWTILETRENFSMVRHLLKQVNLLLHDNRQHKYLHRLLYLRSIRMILTFGTPFRQAWATRNRLTSQVVQVMLMAESIMQWRLIMILTRTSHQGRTLALDSTYQTSITSPWIRMNGVRPRRSIRLDLSLMKLNLGPQAPKCNNLH